jgi:hypothetical protein
MKLPSKAKEIKRTEIEKFGSALLDLLNRTSRPNMLSVKVIKEPFYHSCPPGYGIFAKLFINRVNFIHYYKNMVFAFLALRLKYP